MNSRTIIAVFCIVAICYPSLTSCQSRGETGVRGPLPTRNDGYFGRNRQTQSQSQYQNSAYQNPNIYQQQSQSFVYSPPSYAPIMPEYYDSRNPQYYSSQPSYSQNPDPYVASPAFIPSPPQTYYSPYPQNYNQQNSQASYKPAPFQNLPPKKVYQNSQTQQKPTFDSRLDDESTSSQAPIEEFTTRPKNKAPRRPATTRRPPPPLLNSRFDDRNSASFKKSLNYDNELSDSMEKFSLEIFDQFCLKLENENFMISPFSIYHLLVLVAEGAAGNTYAEISKKLNLISIGRTRDFQQYLNEALKKNTADITLKKFAMLVTDRARPIKNDYEEAVERTYEADVQRVNFLDVDNTVRKINDEVSKATEGEITDTVVREDLFKAQLILLSGLFFRGKWMNVFNTTFTKQEPFYDTNGNPIGNVNMMFQRGPLAYAAIADIGCHVLELPYAEAPVSSRGDIYGTGLSMIIVLPRKGLSLTEAINKVYSFSMNKIYKELYNAKLEYEDEEVEIHLPRFEITTSLDVKDTLETLGIKDVFDQSQADLSNINTNYFVSSMIHKTKISVDEKGTTAAAVATSVFANKATPPKFHANKPFLFFIVDKFTNLILFSGQYASPELY